MYVIEALFNGQWGLIVRCINPLSDRAEFLSLMESQAILQWEEGRHAMPLRLRSIWEAINATRD